MKQSHILSLAYLALAIDTPFYPTRLLHPKGLATQHEVQGGRRDDIIESCHCERSEAK